MLLRPESQAMFHAPCRGHRAAEVPGDGTVKGFGGALARTARGGMERLSCFGVRGRQDGPEALAIKACRRDSRSPSLKAGHWTRLSPGRRTLGRTLLARWLDWFGGVL
jgi:hypothetical protein